MEHGVDALVSRTSAETVETLAGLSSDPNFRSPLMKAGLREICLNFARLDGISGDELGAHLAALSERFRPADHAATPAPAAERAAGAAERPVGDEPRPAKEPRSPKPAPGYFRVRNTNH